MKRIRKYIRIYFRLWQLLMKSSMEYSGWPFKFATTIIYVVTEPLAIWLLFERFGSIGNWDADRIILVYALAVASFGLAEVFGRGFDCFPANMIRTGNFDRLLLRPCSLFVQTAASAFHAHRLIRPAICITLSIALLIRMGVTFTLRTAALYLGGLLGGFLMYTGVFVLTSGISFYTIQALDWVFILTNGSYQTTRVPPQYMPRGLRYLFTFLLPLIPVSFYPAAAICHWGGAEILGWFALPAGAVFLAVSNLVWRVGVRHYTSTGS